MKRRGPGGVSGEDAALWEHVTRGIKRIGARNMPRRLPGSSDMDAPNETMVVESMPKPATSRPVKPSLPQPTRSVGPPPVAGIEAGKTKRIARGRDQIDARIDLHGMRQSEAHAALRGFLVRAYTNGSRLVLVITGKGRPNDAPADAPFDLFRDRERGVLRRSVPLWLSDPDLRAIVVGFTTAHARHGGDGAFYVQVRNRDRHKG